MAATAGEKTNLCSFIISMMCKHRYNDDSLQYILQCFIQMQQVYGFIGNRFSLIRFSSGMFLCDFVFFLLPYFENRKNSPVVFSIFTHTNVILTTKGLTTAPSGHVSTALTVFLFYIFLCARRETKMFLQRESRRLLLNQM